MKHHPSRWSLVAFVGLGLGALWLRLRHLGYTEMWGDQALTLNIALEWVHGGALPLASMKSSFGVFHPPLVEYLYALPLFIRPDILGVVWLIAVINLLGMGLAGWATAHVFGHRVGWWAMLLFIVNPWAVYYSRLIWMPSFVPAFAALVYACVLLYFAEAPRWRYVIGGALSLSAVIQNHIAGVVLLPALGLVAACFPHRLRGRQLLLGLALFVISFLPFILFQFRTHFVDLEALRTGLGRSAETSLAIWLVLLDLLQSKGIYVTLGIAAELGRAFDTLGPFADASIVWLFSLALGRAVVAVLLALPALWAKRNVPEPVIGQMLTVVWVIVPVLAFLYHSHYLQNYYFLFLFPVPFVLLALLAEHIYLWLNHSLARRPFGQQVALMAFAPLGLIALQQAQLDVYGQNLLATGASGQQRVLDVRQAITTAQRLLADEPACQLVVISEGAEFETSRFGLLREFIGRDRVRFARAGTGYLLPQPCAFYFHTTSDTATEAWLESIAHPILEATIQTPEQLWTFYYLPTAERERAATRWQTGAQHDEWSNGLQLWNVEVQGTPHPGTTLTVQAVWAVTQATRPEPLHFGHYLLTADTSVVAQADGPGMDSTQWQSGDIFQTNFQLVLPPNISPGDYTLAIALYHYPQIENVPLLNSEDTLLRLDTVTINP